MSSNVAELTKRELKNNLEAIKNHVTDGGCSNFEEYREAVGKISAFELILRVMDDLEKKLLEE